MNRDAFMRTILANPDDNGPRLVFADWLEERGETAQAEFIRVQCELVKKQCNPKMHLKQGQHRLEFIPDEIVEACDVCHLRSRERELLERHGFEWSSAIASSPHWSRNTNLEFCLVNSGISWQFICGFPGRVTTTAALWCGEVCPTCNGLGWCFPAVNSQCPSCRGQRSLPGLAGPICHAAPIREVTLSDRQPFHDNYIGGAWAWSCGPGTAAYHLPLELWQRLPGVHGDWTDHVYPTEAVATAALSRAALLLGRDAPKLNEKERKYATA
jgi:uncharacterized protein (TIGR02996 family)